MCRPFREPAKVTGTGLGFTSSNIFIPAQIIAAAKIRSSDWVEGISVAHFEKERGKWGMKGVDARKVAPSDLVVG